MKSIEAVKAPAQQPIDDKAGQFVIADDDDLDESTQESVNPDDLPPYAPPQASTSSAPALPSPAPEKPDYKPSQEQEDSNGIHYIQPSETLQGIAFSYGVKPSQLITLNKLPLAVLSTQPSLLHTRSFLLLPAGVQSRAPDPHDAPDVAYYKSVLRRFQMASKCADPSVADVYVKAAFEKKQQELDFIRANQEARMGQGGIHQHLQQTVPEQGGELEDALEAFRLDEKWEREHPQVKGHSQGNNVGGSKGKGKWTGLTASLLKGKV